MMKAIKRPRSPYYDWKKAQSNEAIDHTQHETSTFSHLRQHNSEAGSRSSIIVEGRHSNVYHKVNTTMASGMNFSNSNPHLLMSKSDATLESNSTLSKSHTLPHMTTKSSDAKIPMHVNASSDTSSEDEDESKCIYSHVDCKLPRFTCKKNSKQVRKGSLKKTKLNWSGGGGSAQRVDVIRSSMGSTSAMFGDSRHTLNSSGSRTPNSADYIDNARLSNDDIQDDAIMETSEDLSPPLYLNAPFPQCSQSGETNLAFQTYANTYTYILSAQPISRKVSLMKKIRNKLSKSKIGNESNEENCEKDDPPVYLQVIG